MDYPRFERVEGPQDRLHLAYNGGRMVELVLRTTDLLLAAWPRRKPLSNVAKRLMEGLVAGSPPRQPSKT
jgi:hypothetical protein